MNFLLSYLRNKKLRKMNFSLYTSLSSDLLEKDLTSTQKTYFLKNIKKMDLTGHELIYALVKVYSREHSEHNSYILPYKGKFIKEDLAFDLNNFPNKLKQMLYKFVKIHIKKMKEDQKLQKLQKV